MVTLVSWGVKEILCILVLHANCYGILFVQNYHAGHEVVIHIVLVP